jgi:type I restriction enzyme S subunit
MDNWKKGTLGGLCSIEIGGTPSRNNPDYWDSVKETANRWVAIRDLSRRVVCETAERITALGVNNSNAKLQQEGTVLLSFKLSIGRVAFAGCDLYTNEAIAGLRSEVLSSEFLYYGLQQWDLLQNVDQAIKGATLNKDKLKKIEFDYPQSDREQAKIAEVLSALDHAIEQTEELMAKQQSIKTGLMQGLLTKGIDEHGKIRCETTHAFKDSPLGRIPVEWDVQELKSLLADVDPAMRSGPFGSALLKEELAEVGIPLLGIDNVFPEKFVSDYKRFVPPKKAQQLRRYLVRSHDLMITIMGTVGRCCVVPDDIGEALSSKHVWTVSLDQTKYSPYVACLQINSAPWVLEHFAKDEQGGIMSSIRAETLRTMRLPVPPRSELEKIENVLRSISADLVEKKLLSEKLISLKVGLMRDLLTGERRVISLLAQVAAQ